MTTSGWSLVRGYEALEGFSRPSQKPKSSPPPEHVSSLVDRPLHEPQSPLQLRVYVMAPVPHSGVVQDWERDQDDHERLEPERSVSL
jgi:hypothetical protein